MKDFENLKISNQLCFPLYVCSKEINRKYNDYFAELDLTYTQYITMMVLWENEIIDMKSLEEILYLDSGTLSPVLKKLKNKKYIESIRDENDLRNVKISLTEDGKKLKEKASIIPNKISSCVNLTKEEAAQLYNLLYKIIDGLKNRKELRI